MSLEDQLKGPSQRLLTDVTGRPVTLINSTMSGAEDDWGDSARSESTIETRAEFEFPGSAQFEARVGSDVDVDALVFVPVDVGIDAGYGTTAYGDTYGDETSQSVPGVFDGTESQDRNPTQVRDERSNAIYEVRSYFDEHNGRARLHTVR